MGGGFDVSRFLLPAEGVVVEQMVDRCVSGKLFALLSDFGVVGIFLQVLGVVKIVLLVLEGVETVEYCVFLRFVLTGPRIGLRMESGGVFLCIQSLFDGVALFGHFSCKLRLLLQKLIKTAFFALSSCFGLKSAFGVQFAALLFLKFPDFAFLLCETSFNLFADVLLPALESLEPFLLPFAFLAHESFEFVEEGGRAPSGGHGGYGCG